MRKIKAVALIALAPLLLHAGDIPDISAAKSNPDLGYAAIRGMASDSQDALRRNMMRNWERSLVPLFASQSLDAASSYGYRELNPLLADPNGRFGVKATSVKFAVVGALVGVEYVLVRKSPKTARLFSRLNWSSAAVTTGLAVHNYVVR